jgi:hypothetical protein
MSEILGTQCVACGVKRKHKSLRYHPETLMPYCENAWVCVEAHPNSPINLIERQSQMRLLTFKEANEAYGNGIINEHTEKMKRLLGNPLTVRITSVEMAEFLINQSKISEKTISELVRGFVEDMMDKSKSYNGSVSNDSDKKSISIEIEQVSNGNNDDLIF